LYTTKGLSWTKKTAETFQVNFCAYFSKGLSNYVGIWDFNEFFIPKGENKNILDVLKKESFIKKNEKNCYIQFYHGILVYDRFSNDETVSNNDILTDNLWIGKYLYLTLLVFIYFLPIFM
jgi:hypothetical protein